MPFKTALEAAIAHLIGAGVVTSNAQVARALGYKGRSTLSDYSTGRKDLPEDLPERFRKTYGVRISDFADKVNGETPAPISSETAISGTMLKSIEDLSYSCRTNADSIKVLVENDGVKSRSLEAMIQILAVNLGIDLAQSNLRLPVQVAPNGQTDAELQAALERQQGGKVSKKTADKRSEKGS